MFVPAWIHLEYFRTRAGKSETDTLASRLLDLSVTIVFERSSNREANPSASNDSGPLETLARNLGGWRRPIRGF